MAGEYLGYSSAGISGGGTTTYSGRAVCPGSAALEELHK